MSKDLEKWARELRVRAFAMGVEVQQIAMDLEYSRPHVSNVLRGHVKSEPACQKIQDYLDKIEAEESFKVAA